MAVSNRVCGICDRKFVYLIDSVLACEFCDRRKCSNCQMPDISGKAGRCRGCDEVFVWA